MQLHAQLALLSRGTSAANRSASASSYATAFIAIAGEERAVGLYVALRYVDVFCVAAGERSGGTISQRISRRLFHSRGSSSMIMRFSAVVVSGRAWKLELQSPTAWPFCFLSVLCGFNCLFLEVRWKVLEMEMELLQAL